MKLDNKTVFAQALMIAVSVLFGIATLAMLLEFEPFYSGYYSFAWWCYIIFIESFLYLRGGRSLLFKQPAKFLLLLPVSITVWLVFEALNFRLSNWHYVNIPSDILVRWTGYPIAYASVLPGIFSTKNMLEFTGVFKNSRVAPLKHPQRLYKPFILIGLFFLILPLVWPEYFFPLVWGAFIFLLEPVNHYAGAVSILRDWERGSFRNFYLLMLAGAFCGLLWESWNFWAGSKWIYTVPHTGFFKIFEMPLLGFLGFPPFAVECCAMAGASFLLISRIRENYHRLPAFGIYSVLAASVVIFDLLVFKGIDHFTIISFQAFVPFGVRH